LRLAANVGRLASERVRLHRLAPESGVSERLHPARCGNSQQLDDQSTIVAGARRTDESSSTAISVGARW